MVVPSGKEHRSTPFEGYDKSAKVRGPRNTWRPTASMALFTNEAQFGVKAGGGLKASGRDTPCVTIWSKERIELGLSENPFRLERWP